MSLQEPTSSATGSPRSGGWGRWVMIVLVLVGGLGVCMLSLLVTYFFVRLTYQNFRIDGASMSPALLRGDYALVNRRVYSAPTYEK